MTRRLLRLVHGELKGRERAVGVREAVRLVALTVVGVGLMVWGAKTGEAVTVWAGAGMLAVVARHRPAAEEVS